MTVESTRLPAAISLDVEFPDFPDAACVDADPEVFFPKSGGGYVQSVQYAKTICFGCPEQVACLEWALGPDREEYGIWGGATELERKAFKRGLPPLVCQDCGRTWPDPGRQGRKPKRCPVCRARRR